jgi:hypothetical protein
MTPPHGSEGKSKRRQLQRLEERAEERRSLKAGWHHHPDGMT